MTAPDAQTAGETLRAVVAFLEDAGLEVDHLDGPGGGGARGDAGGRIGVQLPGEKKLRTHCAIVVGPRTVDFEAFVCRRPDEDRDRVYAHLLRRNRRLYCVSYTLDDHGDIYLVGSLSTPTFAVADLDLVVGSIQQAADGDFNTILELGFHTAIRREWEWRVARGESLRNLEAFRHLAEDGRPAAPEAAERDATSS